MELYTYGKRTEASLAKILEFNGPLVLHGNPSLPSHAANKAYVDNVFNSINFDKITSGTIPASLMPAIGGDWGTGPVVNWSLYLKPMPGLVPGVYPKVTVNSKGLVTVGSLLEESDIPPVPYSKVTTGKPTTLADFGITDAFSTTDDKTVTNFPINQWEDPALGAVSGNSVLIKSKADQLKAASTSIYAIGDIVRLSKGSLPPNPSSWLSCIGASVPKATYPSLYSAIGDELNKYDEDMHFGMPWTHTKKDLLTDTPTAYNNYTVAGGAGNDMGVFRGASGTISPHAIKLPIPLVEFASIVTKNKIYIFGGQKNDGYYTDKIWSTNVDQTTGDIGAWTESSVKIPSYGRSFSGAVCMHGFIFLKSKFNGRHPSFGNEGFYAHGEVLKCTIDSNGEVTGITTETSTFHYNESMFVLNGRLCFAGGISFSDPVIRRLDYTIRSHKVKTTGLVEPTYAEIAVLPVTTSGTAAIITPNFLGIRTEDSVIEYTTKGFVESVTNYCLINYNKELSVQKDYTRRDFDSVNGYRIYYVTGPGITYISDGAQDLRLTGWIPSTGDGSKAIAVDSSNIQVSSPKFSKSGNVIISKPVPVSGYYPVYSIQDTGDVLVTVGGIDPSTQIRTNKILVGRTYKNATLNVPTFLMQNEANAILNLSEATSEMQVVAVKNFIYAMGGTTASGVTDNIYAIPYLGTTSDYMTEISKVFGPNSPSEFLIPDLNKNGTEEYDYYIKAK